MAPRAPRSPLTCGRGAQRLKLARTMLSPGRERGLLHAAAAADRLVAGRCARPHAGAAAEARIGRIGLLLAAATTDGLVAGQRARPHAGAAAGAWIGQIGLLLAAAAARWLGLRE